MGQWAIRIRQLKNLTEKYSISTLEDLTQLKKSEGSSAHNTYIITSARIYLNLTIEEREQLESAGVFESPIDSSIDEKIDRLIAWNDKYPLAQTTPNFANYLRQYAHSDSEYQELLVKHEKMCRYYDYVRTRKSTRSLKSRARKTM